MTCLNVLLHLVLEHIRFYHIYDRYSMEQFRPPITAYPQNIAKDEQKPEQNCAVESSVTTDTSNADDGRLSCSRESTEEILGNKQTADATGDATRWSHQGKNDGSVPVQVWLTNIY